MFFPKRNSTCRISPRRQPIVAIVGQIAQQAATPSPCWKKYRDAELKLTVATSNGGPVEIEELEKLSFRTCMATSQGLYSEARADRTTILLAVCGPLSILEDYRI